jgi:cell division protein FtsX
MVYGFIAGLIAIGIGFLILNAAAPGLAGYGVAVGSTIDFLTTYIPFAILAMVTLGALVGAFSSLLATRKYLKI